VRSGFGGRDISQSLQEYGEPRLGEGVVGVCCDALAGESEGFVKASGVFEGSEEGVGRGRVVGIECEGALQVGHGPLRIAGGHLVEARSRHASACAVLLEDVVAPAGMG
jgi:hypothetical protein